MIDFAWIIKRRREILSFKNTQRRDHVGFIFCRKRGRLLKPLISLRFKLFNIIPCKRIIIQPGAVSFCRSRFWGSITENRPFTCGFSVKLNFRRPSRTLEVESRIRMKAGCGIILANRARSTSRARKKSRSRKTIRQVIEK